MLKRTLSIAKGKGVLGHNSREFTAENIDTERTKFNTCYIHEDIKKVYHKLFDVALEKYNNKQKRNDRKIPDYYEKIRTSKQEKVFYEIIAQVGNLEDMSCTSEYGKLAEQILDEYMKGFIERNPTLYVFSAHLHMDEATPHLHIDFVPYTSGNTRGLETKNTLKGALEKLGFTGGTRSDTELAQWQNAEKERLAEIMLQYGIEWDKKGTHKEHLPVLDFKKEMRTQEVLQLEEKVEAISETLAVKEKAVSFLKAEISKEEQELKSIKTKKTKLKKVDEIEVKPAFLDGGKVVVAKEEFEDVKALAKKQIVAESKKQKMLAENVVLREENKLLSKELNEYKSIKNRLSMAGVEAELSNVKKLLNRVLEFVEKLGLKAQLEKFLNQKIDKVKNR
jgi:hypothetical protein